jgi:DNA-binding NarL/FixJ family response regulator
MASRILVVDDHALFREGLVSLINEEDDLQVVGEASDGRQALEAVRGLRPDLVLMDVSMPELNGIEATRQIRHDFPETRVIALSQHSDKRFVREMFKAGASGYLLKHGAFDELHRAIAAVLDGQTYVSSRVAGVVVEGYVDEGARGGTGLSALTAREREVLQLLAEGYVTKEIGARLHLSPKTVDTHRRNLMQKLDIDNLADLTKYAVREGLTSLEQ